MMKIKERMLSAQQSRVTQCSTFSSVSSYNGYKARVYASTNFMAQKARETLDGIFSPVSWIFLQPRRRFHKNYISEKADFQSLF